MHDNGTFNILMYSHDTFGLGHIRRTMAIANHLRADDINVLILTGSPIAGRFSFSEHVDFVRIPGMIKKTNEDYQPMSIKIHPTHALSIRKNIITATARAFKPHMFIVDKEPLGLKKEVLPTLQWFRRSLPSTRTILGLRDIMDDAQSVRADWSEKGVYRTLDKLYSEIWIYGVQALYDPVREYLIPESVHRKMHFTGYIPRKNPSDRSVAKLKRELTGAGGQPLVVVTTGGGGDGFELMDTYLEMLEANGSQDALSSVLITGPFMPNAQRDQLFERSRRLGVRAYRFYRRMEKIFAAADLVVCMGGYNTMCEILTQKTPALVVPREVPRMEQRIRAEAFQRQGLVDCLPWNQLESGLLRQKIDAMLSNPQPYRQAMEDFELTGFDAIRQRLQHCRSACQ